MVFHRANSADDDVAISAAIWALTVETISRLLGRFQKSGMLAVKGKYITVKTAMRWRLAGHTRNVSKRQLNH